MAHPSRSAKLRRIHVFRQRCHQLFERPDVHVSLPTIAVLASQGTVLHGRDVLGLAIWSFPRPRRDDRDDLRERATTNKQWKEWMLCDPSNRVSQLTRANRSSLPNRGPLVCMCSGSWMARAEPVGLKTSQGTSGSLSPHVRALSVCDLQYQYIRSKNNNMVLKFPRLGLPPLL